VPEKPDPPRILVVDDEPLVRDLVREVLVREGYAVLHAHTAEEALALVRAHEHDRVPDLLVTDLTMPGMDGVTLARTLRTAYPTLVALLMSGGPADHRLDCAGDLHGADAAGPFFFLQKPFSIEGLRKAVRSALKSIR
jgi:CheY-like chemotaxis protein